MLSRLKNLWDQARRVGRFFCPTRIRFAKSEIVSGRRSAAIRRRLLQGTTLPDEQSR